jgi:hypothetical protein
MRETWIACVGMLVACLAACEETSQVGSGCVDGVCPEALSREDDACKITSGIAELALSTGEHLSACLATPLRRYEDGTVQARVLYQLPALGEQTVRCTERAYLKPVDEELRAAYRRDNPGGDVCELNQLAVIQVDGGEPTIAAGGGFYFDDFSNDLAVECGPGSAGRIVITLDAQAWEATTVLISTIEVVGASGGIPNPELCDPIRGSEPIGTQCLPSQRVYHDSQAVIETRSAECGDGVCIAYYLNGDTDARCALDNMSRNPDVDCAPLQEIVDRTYCTCRCDAPPGSAELCQCPEDFSCVDIVDLRDDVAGSYCVKNGRAL